MLEHDRPAAALDLITDHLDDAGSGTLIGRALDALEHFVRSTGREVAAQVSPYEFGEVMKAVGAAALEGVTDEHRVAVLEFAYLPMLESDGTPPADLYRGLSRCADLFVEAVRTKFPAEGEERTERSDLEHAAAERARLLLSSWRHVPGLGPGR